MDSVVEINAMLDAFKRGDMEEVTRLKAIAEAGHRDPGYADDIQINGWGDRSGIIPDPDTVSDRQLAARARRARTAVEAAQEAGTLTAHVDASFELERAGYPRHATAIMILAKRLAA